MVEDASQLPVFYSTKSNVHISTCFLGHKLPCSPSLSFTEKMVSIKVLQEWCRVTCASYPGVEIKDLSTSFRDGLAFCAIIHKHRPDLIDFRSLSKDNAYENNKLAFRIAETKLGIPALLHPTDMVSSKQPDYLSVLAYLSQYYNFFIRKACVSPSKLGSAHVRVFNTPATRKTWDDLTHTKSLTDGETGEENRFVNTRPRTVCYLCFKPVHIIQRRLVEGKVFHRSCFRCKVCSCSLLPDSYTPGSDPGSLICSYHVADSPRLHLNQEIASPNIEEGGCYSLAGFAISTVPQYTNITESQDRPVSGATGAMKEIDRVSRSSPVHPQDSVKDRTVKESGNSSKAPRSSTETSLVTDSRPRPVPAPRRSLDSSVTPVPPVQVRMSQTTNGTESSTNHSKSLPSPSHMSQQTSTNQKVKLNHPWKVILHPGPWTQLPPAPPPIPPPRSKTVAQRQSRSDQSKVSPHNPFEEDEEEKEEADLVSSIQTNSSASVDPEDKHEDPDTATYATVNKNRLYPSIPSSDSEEKEVKPPSQPTLPKSVFPEAAAAGSSSEAVSFSDSEAAGVYPTLKEVLPRSISVPAMTSDHGPSVTVSVSEERQSATSCRRKQVSRENPFDRNPGMTKSKTLQELSSRRGPAPGHGFPLIKRKVQTDPRLSSEDVEVQMRELDKRVEALEQRGLELERNLRACRNDKEEERMLAEWFSLIHERQILLRRDAELVYQMKQQKLEDRHADVEFELRCLLIKPESDWTEKDRDREQQLMEELVAIIEQRNLIVSCLEQDRQREKNEDLLFEENMKVKELPKEKQMEVKKSVGKLRPTKVFKLLGHRSESHKKS